MSLRTKFGVLLGLMALAVCLALGAAWWSLSTMRREVRDPFQSMSDVMVELNSAKRGVEDASVAMLGAPAALHDPNAGTGAEARDAHALRSALERADAAMLALRNNEWVGTRAGATAVRNVQARLNDARAQVFSADPAQRALAARSLVDVHELVERIETRLVNDTQEAIRFGARLENQLGVILALCLLVAAMAIALGLSLVRRWVLAPVAALRLAAERIGSGDFEHRVAVAPTRRPDELARLAGEVNTMAGMVKTMQEQKVEQERLAAIGEMVRRLAHNLRNPLAGIRGLAELTRADLNGAAPDPADLRENQTRIISAVDRFEKWLNELLSVTRPMQVHPSPTPIASWLSGLVDAHTPQARTLDVRLELSVLQAPEIALIDARHLEHAVSAILSNALEAAAGTGRGGEGHGRVWVDVQAHGDTWTIEVIDNGAGVTPEVRERMFRPYFTTKRDGNGIGLAIVQQVVVAHSGQVEVESPPTRRLDGFGTGSGGGRGTCLRLRLPMTGATRLAPAADLRAVTGQEGKSSGEDPGDRGRGEPAVHDQAGAGEV